MHILVPSNSFSVFYRYSAELVENIVRLCRIAAETASIMSASEYRFHPWNVRRAVRDAVYAVQLDGCPADFMLVALILTSGFLAFWARRRYVEAHAAVAGNRVGKHVAASPIPRGQARGKTAKTAKTAKASRASKAS